MKVKVLATFPYGMKYRRTGEILDLPDKVAELYMKLGRVAAHFEEEVKPKRRYRRRDVQPVQTTVMEPETEVSFTPEVQAEESNDE